MTNIFSYSNNEHSKQHLGWSDEKRFFHSVTIRRSVLNASSLTQIILLRRVRVSVRDRYPTEIFFQAKTHLEQILYLSLIYWVKEGGRVELVFHISFKSTSHRHWFFCRPFDDYIFMHCHHHHYQSSFVGISYVFFSLPWKTKWWLISVLLFWLKI